MTYRRDEDEDEKLDRHWNELLQELRIAQTGTQVLFALVLTIPFTQPFRNSGDFTHAVYAGTLIAAAIALGLFLAPVPFHRILYRQLLRDKLIAIGGLFTQIGLVFLMAALSGGMLIGLDVIIDRSAAIAIVAVLAFCFLTLWFAVPTWIRHTNRRRRSEG